MKLSEYKEAKRKIDSAHLEITHLRQQLEHAEQALCSSEERYSTLANALREADICKREYESAIKLEIAEKESSIISLKKKNEELTRHCTALEARIHSAEAQITQVSFLESKSVDFDIHQACANN